MDQNDLGLSRYDAGAEYLKALRKLGLEPEALFWAHDSIIDRVILVLVTRVFDYAGPLELSKLLFKAYDSSATPREIDPFIIRVHSPFQKIYRELKTHLGNRIGHVGWTHESYSRATIAREVEPAATFQMKYGSLTSFGSWVYKYSPEPKKVADSERVWNRFRQNVADAAA